MGWLKKIFSGSDKIIRAHYREESDDDAVSDDHIKSPSARSESDNEEIDHAIALSLADDEHKKGKAIESSSYVDEDEMLARALQESLNSESPPHHTSQFYQPFPYFVPLEMFRVCAGCRTQISQGRFRNFMGHIWHSECFRCSVCMEPMSEAEAMMHNDRLYHKSCFKQQHSLICHVCKSYIPTDRYGRIEYRVHPFWQEKFCPSHEKDGTPRCCSCERMEPRDAKYVTLDDGRRLCLECLNSSIMDTSECQPLYLDIREFYEGLNMKVEQQIPLLLVERQALNEAMEGEKTDYHHLPETRGLCLAEEQIIRTVLRRPRFGPGNIIMDLITGPYRLVRHCEVTAILILYGLPRLLTGSILAHEMMHAWLRLNDYRSLRPEVEEGICQVLAHLWLESEIMAGSNSSASSSSSSSSSSSGSNPSSSSSKKGKRAEFERRLGEFFKFQIEADTSHAYGHGFRTGIRAVNNYGLRRTLDHIKYTETFP